MNKEKLTQLPTEEEIEQATSVLARLAKGFLPYPLFLQVVRLMTTPTMEVAPVRMRDSKPEVFLTQRPAEDPHWPSGWHIPGTVIRSTDKEGSFESGFERVLRDELGSAFRFTQEPQFVGIKFWDVLRGRELDMLHYVAVEVDEHEILPGKFFTFDELPATTLSHHKIMIPEIFEAYMKEKR